jgi:hypothetical protein
VLNVKLVDKVSIVKLHVQTKTLTFNQIAIESMESKGLFRGTSQGKLNSTSRQQTSQSFREQAIRVWNWPHLDKDVKQCDCLLSLACGRRLLWTTGQV